MTPAKHLEAAARSLRDAGARALAVKAEKLLADVLVSTHACECCGSAFIARKDARYCSAGCRVKANREKHENPAQ